VLRKNIAIERHLLVLKKICQGGGGWILGLFGLFFEGVLGKVAAVDGFFVVSLWCFDGGLWFLVECFFGLRFCHFFEIFLWKSAFARHCRRARAHKCNSKSKGNCKSNSRSSAFGEG
jgi:hypothetical protein